MAVYDITKQITALHAAGYTDAQIEALGPRVDVRYTQACNVASLTAVNAAVDSLTRIEWARLSDGTWGIRGRGLTTGETVTVTKRNGATSTEVVGEILTDADGTQTATIATTPRRSTRPGGTTWGSNAADEARRIGRSYGINGQIWDNA